MSLTYQNNCCAEQFLVKWNTAGLIKEDKLSAVCSLGNTAAVLNQADLIRFLLSYKNWFYRFMFGLSATCSSGMAHEKHCKGLPILRVFVFSLETLIKFQHSVMIRVWALTSYSFLTWPVRWSASHIPWVYYPRPPGKEPIENFWKGVRGLNKTMGDVNGSWWAEACVKCSWQQWLPAFKKGNKGRDTDWSKPI